MAKSIITKFLFFSIIFFCFAPFAISGDYGAVIEIPYIDELPDYDYPNATAITWQGGESKFGKWRNFFNGYEMGWGVAYNTRWNYKDNTWEPRDSIDERASVCAMARFNISEGQTGGDVFEINFAPGSNENTPPDWGGAATYFFYNGDMERHSPAVFQMIGAGNMDTVIKMCPNEGGNPRRVNIRNSSNGLFIEREQFGSIVYGFPYSSVTWPLLSFDYSDNVGVGIYDPVSKLDVDGELTLRAVENILPDPPEVPSESINRMSFKMEDETGNVILTVHYNGETRKLVIPFQSLQKQ